MTTLSIVRNDVPDVHPAAELFPLVQGREFDDLAEDIRINGLNEPIKTLDGLLIDGRNRLAACQKAGVAPRYEELPKGTDPLKYVISANIHRRHLTTAQRAAIAADLANMKAGEFHGNQWSGSNDPDQKISIEEAAEMMNVGPASVKRAKAVKRDDPELHEATKAGGREAARDLERERDENAEPETPQTELEDFLEIAVGKQRAGKGAHRVIAKGLTDITPADLRKKIIRRLMDSAKVKLTGRGDDANDIKLGWLFPAIPPRIGAKLDMKWNKEKKAYSVPGKLKSKWDVLCQIDGYMADLAGSAAEKSAEAVRLWGDHVDGTTAWGAAPVAKSEPRIRQGANGERDVKLLGAALWPATSYSWAELMAAIQLWHDWNNQRIGGAADVAHENGGEWYKKVKACSSREISYLARFFVRPQPGVASALHQIKLAIEKQERAGTLGFYPAKVLDDPRYEGPTIAVIEPIVNDVISKLDTGNHPNRPY